MHHVLSFRSNNMVQTLVRTGPGTQTLSEPLGSPAAAKTVSPQPPPPLPLAATSLLSTWSFCPFGKDIYLAPHVCDPLRPARFARSESPRAPLSAAGSFALPGGVPRCGCTTACPPRFPAAGRLGRCPRWGVTDKAAVKAAHKCGVISSGKWPGGSCWVTRSQHVQFLQKPPECVREGLHQATFLHPRTPPWVPDHSDDRGPLTAFELSGPQTASQSRAATMPQREGRRHGHL